MLGFAESFRDGLLRLIHACSFAKVDIAVLRSLTQSSYRVSRTFGGLYHFVPLFNTFQSACTVPKKKLEHVAMTDLLIRRFYFLRRLAGGSATSGPVLCCSLAKDFWSKVILATNSRKTLSLSYLQHFPPIEAPSRCVSVSSVT